jgi:membrane fusion protein, multidrug efflux system
MDATTDLKSKNNQRAKTLRRATFKQVAIIGLVCTAVVASRTYGYYWWTVGSYFQGWDDAYVGGNDTPTAPHIPVFIAQILVTDNQEVKAGDLFAH